MRWITLITDTPETLFSEPCCEVLRSGVGQRLVRAGLRSGMLAALLLAAQSAVAGTTPLEERELHTAECVASLDVKANALARQVKAGKTELRPSLFATLDAGAAFIGHAYLQGDRDEARSQALLNVALEAQKTLSDADLAARQATCGEEGTRLLAETDLIGRAIVSRLVQRRMQKLLGD